MFQQARDIAHHIIAPLGVIVGAAAFIQPEVVAMGASSQWVHYAFGVLGFASAVASKLIDSRSFTDLGSAAEYAKEHIAEVPPPK